jgi:dTMP kinase
VSDLEMKGLFVTVEGIDGAGKTTQLGWLKDFFQRQGRGVVTTREPGGTSLGEALRALLLSPQQTMDPETETLLIFAARREHLARVILPALGEGKVVLCDRFTDATYAYQGNGRGVAHDRIRALEQWVQRDLQPDLTILFDVPVELGQQRARSTREADRFERERVEFFERVRQGYLQRARENASRFLVVDASVGTLDIHKVLEERLVTHDF